MIFWGRPHWVTLWLLEAAHDGGISHLKLVAAPRLLSWLLIVAWVYTTIREMIITLWTRQWLVRLMVNVVHGGWRLLISVIQQLLGLPLFNPNVSLLLICVIGGLVGEPALRHISTSSLCVYLQGGGCPLVWVASGRIQLRLAILGVCNDVAEVLRVVSLVGLCGVYWVTKEALIGSVHCRLYEGILQGIA